MIYSASYRVTSPDGFTQFMYAFGNTQEEADMHARSFQRAEDLKLAERLKNSRIQKLVEDKS